MSRAGVSHDRCSRCRADWKWILAEMVEVTARGTCGVKHRARLSARRAARSSPPLQGCGQSFACVDVNTHLGVHTSIHRSMIDNAFLHSLEHDQKSFSDDITPMSTLNLSRRSERTSSKFRKPGRDFERSASFSGWGLSFLHKFLIYLITFTRGVAVLRARLSPSKSFGCGTVGINIFYGKIGGYYPL